jgi:hypothetical protein
MPNGRGASASPSRYRTTASQPGIERLIRRDVQKKARGVIPIVVRIHGTDCEALMDTMYRERGADGLLERLRNAGRGSLAELPRSHDVAEAQRRTSAAFNLSSAVTDGPTRTGDVSEGWFDGTEDWGPTEDDHAGCRGLVYYPDSRPTFDPTSRQRWDRPYWSRKRRPRR